MIKKFIIFFILLLSIPFVFTNISFAKENIKTEISSSSAEKRSIDYALPYPGLLPDSPLYVFKVARDAIIKFFISDPLKKADFNLLQADKRLNAGHYLFLKGKEKEQIAISTISKGENYFEKAIQEATKAKTQGADITILLERMILSARKHQEILMELRSNTSKENSKNIEKEFKRAQEFEKKVSKIKAE